MQFPERDLSNQFISRSYQDVVQQYIPTGSFLYLLDGYGNVILQIPSASFGGIVLTQDQSASYAIHSLSASYAPGNPSISASYAETASLVISASTAISAGFAIQSVSASYAPGSPSISASFATTSSYSITCTLANVAEIAENSLSASIADTSSIANFSETSSFALNAQTASYALQTLSASWAPNQFSLQTGSTYPITSSWSQNSVTASVADSASFSVSSSYVIPNNVSVNIPNSNTSSIIQINAAIYNGAFIQYVLTDGVNLRAGNFVAVYTTASVKFNETSTTDIGNNDGLTLSASISSSSILIIAMNSSASDYTMKYSLNSL